MARLPLTVDDPNYHHTLEVFARDIAGQLADVLLDQKISKEIAHETVATFLFNFSMMLDRGGSYKTDGKFKPQIAFSNGLGQIVVPTEGGYLHELAYDITEAAFNVEGRR